MAFETELPGLPQPKDRAPPPDKGARRLRRRLGLKEPGAGKARPRKGGGMRAGGARRSSGTFAKWLTRGLMRFARKLKPRWAKKPKDFRNHGFKNSGRGGFTGFAGMKRRR